MSRSFVVCPVVLVALAGCGGESPPTEVVVVLQSDLVIPSETDGIQMSVSAGAAAPIPSGAQSINEGASLRGDFPVSLAFTAGEMTTSLSLTAQLLLNLFSPIGTSPSVVVSRTITDVRFSPHTKMMLVVPMLRLCACHGTSCPVPGNPECDNIAGPSLQPFDPEVAPPGTLLFGTIEVAPQMFPTH
jgi:hypothetical protein